MPSRFDMAIGKVPKTPHKKRGASIEDMIIKGPLPVRNDVTRQEDQQGYIQRQRNFLSRLKLVNEATGAEMRLYIGDFNLSINSPAEATVSMTFHCTTQDIQRLMEGERR
jgi:hypothetical protein